MSEPPSAPISPASGSAEFFRGFAQQFRAFAALIPQVVWTADADGRLRWMSDNWYAYSGSSPEELAARGTMEDYLHPQEHSGERGRFLEAIATGQPWEAVLRLRGRDGGYRWFLSRALPMREVDGTISRWFGTHTDIDDGRSAEAALRESETRYRCLIEALPQLVWTCRPDGRCDYLSRQWIEYTGLEEAEQLGFEWLDRVVHPDDRERTLDHWRGAVAGRHGYDVDYRIRRHDGAYRWFKVRGTPMRDEAGAVERWFGTCTDIQAIVEARQLLQEEAAENALERRRFFEASHDLLGATGFDCMLKAINPAWPRLLGIREADLFARPFTHWLHPDDRVAAAAGMAELMAETPTFRLENRVRRGDGSYLWIDWTCVREGERIYLVGRDVTEARRAADELGRTQAALRQAQKMEAIGQLTGGVAHDFNNLLTAITGNLELLQRRLARGDHEVGRFAEGALSSAQRAAVLTQRLLAFSRRQALAPSGLDLNAAVAEMEDLIRRTVGDHIRTVVRPAPDLWNTWCDPSQLENALLNLVINARDAMPGGGDLVIETGNARVGDGEGGHPADLAAGDYVRLSVTDTGEGMSQAVAERAFDPFFTTKPLGQGTGLGLSQLYGFALQSGGSAEIRSAPGTGATVSLYLPRRNVEGLVAQPTAAAVPERPAEIGRGRRLVVVEDEALVRAIVVQTLEEQGFGVTAFDEPHEALRRLVAGEPCDLLVTDIGLPGMSGRALVEAVRGARPELKVLFVTGYEHGVDPGAEASAEPDGNALLRKPFAIEALCAAVADLLDDAPALASASFSTGDSTPC